MALLLIPGGLTYEHEICLRVPDCEHHGVPEGPEGPRGRPVLGLLAEGSELFAGGGTLGPEGWKGGRAGWRLVLRPGFARRLQTS